MAQRRRFGFTDTENQLKSTQTNTVSLNEDVSKKSSSTVQDLIKKIDEPVRNYAFEVRPVKRSKMVFSSDNDYPMVDIEKLAEQILELGLIHNIEVYYDEDNDRYIVNAGERRTRAIDLLIDQFKDAADTDSLRYKLYLKHVKPFEVNGYPCKITYPEQERDIYADVSDSDYEKIARIKKHIRMTVSNEGAREQDPARHRRKIQSLSDDYSQLNAILNKDERVNVNKKIAEELHISDRQVKKYKAVSQKLIPELLELFDKNDINLNDGANYAQLTEEEQRQLLSLINSGHQKSEIDALYQKLKALSNDLVQKEKDLQKLAAEKQTADENLLTAQNNVKSIEASIRAELENENAAKVDQLSNELNEAKLQLRNAAQELSLKEKDHAKKLAELSRKQELQKQVSSSDPELMRLSWELDNNIRLLQDLAEKTSSLLVKYSSKYTSDSTEKSPDQFQQEISKISLLKK